MQNFFDSKVHLYFLCKMYMDHVEIKLESTCRQKGFRPATINSLMFYIVKSFTHRK